RIDGQAARPSSSNTRIGGEAQSDHHRLMPACGRRRHFGSDRRIHYLWHPVPGVPIARLPDPSKAGSEGPVAVTVGHPAPGITRHPHITKARIVGPAAILEGAPTGVDEVGLPDVAIPRNGHEVAVIIQVAHAVTVRRVNAGTSGGCVAIVVVVLLAIPGVGGLLFVILGDHESVFLSGSGQIDGRAVFLGNLKWSGGRIRAQLAFENGYGG